MRRNLLPALGCFLMLTLPKEQLSAQAKGPSTFQTPYLLPAKAGVQTTSLLSAGEAIGTYRMAGTPDGLGAFDNGDGTFTLLMNHEFGNSAGAVHAHGATGTFVSQWIIRKSDLTVLSGSDLIKNVALWNGTGYTTYNALNPSPLAALGRFCSADLPAPSAFYNSATGLGTQARIFLNGEETGSEGRGMAHIATGPNAGTSYQLPHLGRFSYENAVANPATGDQTVVAGTDDATPGQVYFYVGTKTNTGTDIERAGLANGVLYGPSVPGMLLESSAGIPAANTPFTMVNLGDVHNLSGGQLNTLSNNSGVTQFLRPEDGAWDPRHPEDFYFVTTNAFNSPSRLWRLRFHNIHDLAQGGTITAVLDGTEGQKMLDNMAIDQWGHILLQEDVGNNAHNGKIWQYTIATDQLQLVAHHDPARFGDIGLAATAPYTRDEEASGIIDMQDILGAGMFLFDDQAHYSMPGEIVEGGQLLALFNPDTYAAACAGFGASLSVTPSPAVARQQPHTLYLGYGPQQVTLDATAGGEAPYSYSWSTGAATPSISVNPTATTTYSATIKDAMGCSAVVSQTISVVDIRDGDKSKVFLCHNGNTLSVSVNAVPAHLAHGDALGNCGPAATREARNSKLETVLLYPNPANDRTVLSITAEEDLHLTVSVLDGEGKLVLPLIQKSVRAGKQQLALETSGLHEGTYFVQVASGTSVEKLKLVVLH